jgi:hypothetical protein
LAADFFVVSLWQLGRRGVRFDRPEVATDSGQVSILDVDGPGESMSEVVSLQAKENQREKEKGEQ